MDPGDAGQMVHLQPQRQKADSTHVLSCKLVPEGRLRIGPKVWSQTQLKPLESLLSGMGIHPVCSRDCLTLDVKQGVCLATGEGA